MKGYYHNPKPDESSGITVVRRSNETIEMMIKRFKKKIAKSGLSDELTRKIYFKKPSVLRREKLKITLNNIRLQKVKTHTINNKRENKKNNINKEGDK